LPAQFTRAFAIRGGFPQDGGAKQLTARYSSANLASSSHAWASCALMSPPLGGEDGGALGPTAKRDPVPRAGEPPRRRRLARRRCLLGR
jgi:hypothetical protein